MARTISQLTEGTVVYLDETVSGTTTHVPYFYLGLDEGGNARLLRQYAAIQKRMNSANVASYSGCEADVWLENTTDGFLSRFDAATINALANTSIKYVDFTLNEGHTAQLVTINRRCFLLSYTEWGWAATEAGSEGKSYLEALKTATGQTGDNAARIGYNESSTAVYVWMRSAYSDTGFRIVYAGGNAGSIGASIANGWLRPALSVAPATSVSDEGADPIFLLPDGRRTTWDVEATMSLGKTTRRAKKAKVSVSTVDMTDITIQVCNNYGDASPAWVTADNNGIAALNNTTKTATDWELGVKITAKGSNYQARIYEPAAIVEFDDA